MKKWHKGLNILLFSAATSTVFAAPWTLTTINDTDDQSNAYFGSYASPYPTAAHSKKSVLWALVKVICYKHSTKGKGKPCTATIKMKTNTNNPVTVGDLSLDLNTGVIHPDTLSKNGYTITAEGPGKARITVDKKS